MIPESEKREGPAPPAGRRLRVLDWGNYATYFKRPVLAPLLWQFLRFHLRLRHLHVRLRALRGKTLHVERPRRSASKKWDIVFAYVGFLGIILQGGLIGRLVRRFGEEKLVSSGFVSATAGIALMGFTYRLPGLLVASCIASFGTGVLRPALTSLITQRAARDEQGVVLGLTQSLMSVAQIIAPVIAGYLIDRQLLTTWALVGAAVSGVGIVIGSFKPPRSGRAN